MKFNFRAKGEENGDYHKTVDDVIDFTLAAANDEENPDVLKNLNELTRLMEEGTESKGYADEALKIYDHKTLGKN